ncbi:MAG: hypothetical protein UX07_C0042G0001, partial [Parcubacteria group bacterium GW2011_GWA2_45_30]
RPVSPRDTGHIFYNPCQKTMGLPVGLYNMVLLPKTTNECIVYMELRLCPRGEMDITPGFGPGIPGSNPGEGVY